MIFLKVLRQGIKEKNEELTWEKLSEFFSESSFESRFNVFSDPEITIWFSEDAQFLSQFPNMVLPSGQVILGDVIITGAEETKTGNRKSLTPEQIEIVKTEIVRVV